MTSGVRSLSSTMARMLISRHAKQTLASLHRWPTTLIEGYCGVMPASLRIFP
jgi:hypothetical protein